MTDHPYAYDEPPEPETPEEAEVTELGERNMESEAPDEPQPRENQTAGLVEVAAAAVHARWIADGEMGPGEPGGPETAVRDMDVGFKAARDAGWRIVRTSSCQCGQPDAVHGEDVVPYPTGERIVEEWTP